MNHIIEPELTQDWGNRLLEGTNRTLCIRTQEKGAVTPQETDPDSPSSLQQTCGLVVACVWGGGAGTEGSSPCRGAFEGGHHYLH